MITLAAVLLLSCNGRDGGNDRVIARAYEHELHWSELRHMIPFDASPQDSAALAQRLIQNWVRQRAVLHQAENNLLPGDMDFEAQLRDHRNSLVIYAFEQALVQQKLDTVVHPQEMEEYHAAHGANFELRDPMLRVRWAKAREEDKRIAKRLQEDFMSGSTERMHELEMWMATRGLSFMDRSRGWITPQQLGLEMGIPPDEAPELTADTGRMVHREGPTLWFIEVLERLNAGDVAPLELVAGDIRAIIINQRKLQLLERMREDLYQQALEQQEIEIH